MAGITPILKNSKGSRGKRLITYTGHIQEDSSVGLASAHSYEGDDLHLYTSGNGRRANERRGGSSHQQGGLVYVLPSSSNRSAGAVAVTSTHSPVSSEVLSSGSEQASSDQRSSRRSLLVRPPTTSVLPYVDPRGERYNPNAAHLPPGAVLLSQLELGQKAPFVRTVAPLQAQRAGLAQTPATSYVLQHQPPAYTTQQHQNISQAAVPLPSSPPPTHSTSTANHSSVKAGVHFEKHRPAANTFDPPSASSRLYDDLGGGSICSWPRKYRSPSSCSNSNRSMINCFQVVFHILSLLMSIVAITLSVMVATGYISVGQQTPERQTPVINTPVIDNSWQRPEPFGQNPSLTPRGTGAVNNIQADVPGRRGTGAVNNIQADVPGRISRIGVLWQKLEDLEKASTDNAQALHGTSFSQDKMTAKLQTIERILGTNHEAAALLSTSYTHWGRGSCPTQGSHNGTIQLAYSGIVAGAADSLPGNGANALCVASRPTWKVFNDVENQGGRLYGATYRVGVLASGTYNVFDGNADPSRLNRKPVPCAVCRVRRATTILHMPATTQCPSGFRHLYDGYLMSAAAAQFKSQYICVDKAAEAEAVPLLSPGAPATPDMSLHPVEAGCGAHLPCQQYPNGRELTCVVCVA